MKRLLLAATVALFASQAHALDPATIKSTWTKVWADEFAAGSNPNSATWNQNWFGSPGQITRPTNSAETGAYDPTRTTVSNGKLKQTSAAQPVTINGTTYPYRVGEVNSQGKVYFSPPMYVEWRAYIPAAANGQIANWPALWINGDNWPGDVEVDVLEGLGGNATWNVHAAGLNIGSGPVSGTWTGWHTFGVYYAVGVLEIYWDGRLVGSVADSAIVNKPHYLLMSNSIGGYGGPVTVPTTLRVEYVRVWRP